MFIGAFGFDLVEGDVRLFEYFGVVFLQAVVERDADANADFFVFVGQLELFVGARYDVVGDLAREIRVVGILHEEDEFVAAEASDDLAVLEIVARQFAHLPDDAVADVVAVRVVDALEVVDVEQEQDSFILGLVR